MKFFTILVLAVLCLQASAKVIPSIPEATDISQVLSGPQIADNVPEDVLAVGNVANMIRSCTVEIFGKCVIP
ncbi:unnamed protein product [Caenorhabditis angaria]|uniref:Uncharacterized protein n=1 Tax=Caenorhabditis angaria TaxID=860376 RepID=A0A9P1NBA8_9PELO|nr:unnamed protein product [Caenorhabditis angaria]